MNKKHVLTLLIFVAALTAMAQNGRTLTAKMPCRLLDGIAERPYAVYLPNSYYTDTQRKYPVLYLLHGGGGSHTDWERGNRLSQTADSLIGCGAIKDIIVVCAEGNQQHMMYFNAEKGRYGAPDWKYEDYFFNELIPYIENTYRARTDKGGRAIAGFSMGGGAATVYGLHHPEKFCMVYNISGYLRRQPLEFLKNDPSAEWRQAVIEQNNPIVRASNGTATEVNAWKQVAWKIAVGDEDFTLEANMDFVKALRAKGIPCSMHVDAGNHNFDWVTPHLEDALKLADKHFTAAAGM
jgi:enterochelin esterase-like enzyme